MLDLVLLATAVGYPEMSDVVRNGRFASTDIYGILLFDGCISTAMSLQVDDLLKTTLTTDIEIVGQLKGDYVGHPGDQSAIIIVT